MLDLILKQKWSCHATEVNKLGFSGSTFVKQQLWFIKDHRTPEERAENVIGEAPTTLGVLGQHRLFYVEGNGKKHEYLDKHGTLLEAPFTEDPAPRKIHQYIKAHDWPGILLGNWNFRH